MPSGSRTAAAALLAVVLGVRVDSQPPMLAPALPVDVGPGSGDAWLVDVNGDRQLDLVTRHLLTRLVNVRFGDGTGGFRTGGGTRLEFDYQPAAMAVGDVNGDGSPDFAVAHRDSLNEYVELLFGDGHGGFAARSGSRYVTGPFVEFYKPGVMLMDFNEDGYVDVITANGRRNVVTLLAGDGRGTFVPGPVVTLERGRDNYSFVLGTIDADRHLDLVVASNDAPGRPAHALVRAGDGKGRFREARASAPTVPPRARIEDLEDMDGDGRLDVVISHLESRFASVLLNTGDGFAIGPGSPVDIGADAYALTAADMNRDGRADLVAATADSVTVLLGDGRTFAQAPGSPFRAGPGAYNLTVADINGDGRPDVAASSFEGSSVTILLGR